MKIVDRCWFRLQKNQVALILKIIKKLDKFTKDGIYAKAIKTSESKYAIVWVYNTDKQI